MRTILHHVCHLKITEEIIAIESKTDFKMDAENVIDLYVEELSKDYLFQFEEHLKKLKTKRVKHLKIQ